MTFPEGELCRFWHLLNESDASQAYDTALVELDACMVGELRHWKLPEGVLPLASNRAPMSALGEDVIVTCVHNTFATERAGRKVGRFSDSIRQVLGVHRDEFRLGITLESHIDLTGLPNALARTLLFLGYEPDDFATLVPECYTRHLTLKVEMTLDSPLSVASVSNAFRLASAEAAIAVQEASGVSGFIEDEIYPSSLSKTYDSVCDLTGRKEAQEELAAVMARFSLANSSKWDESWQRKRADVHVKLRVSDGAISRMLQSLGFYSIVSEAGNRIFTAQFLYVSDAKEVFNALDVVLTASGEAKSIVLEVCTAMWRKGNVRHGKFELAEVSPVFVPN